MKSLFTSSVRPYEANRRYILPGLDGLRAIAVLLVIVYHFWPTVLPGGMIGVDIFFVISGFLITSLLLREGALNGRIALGSFWVRRARRLLPAIALMILVLGPVSLIVGGDIQVNLGRQLLGAATFSSNWISIFAGNDYFAQTSPELFTNFWSLAVEEQFYVLWPLLIVASGLLLGRRWRHFSAIMVLGILASLGVAAFLLMNGTPISRIYYGTDTHLYGLLLGALLAFARPWSLYPPMGKKALYRVAQPFGLIAFTRVMVSWLSLFALIPYAILVPESAPGAIPWGLFGASLLALGVIQGMLPDMLAGASEALRRLLNFAPLRWVGERSYGLYLWHWPLAVVMHYVLGADRSPLVNVGVLVATFAIAEMSYRWIETPIRRRGFRESANRVIASFQNATVKALPIALTLLVIAAAGATGVAVRTAPAMTTAQQSVEDGKRAAAERLKARQEARASASASASAAAKDGKDAKVNASASASASQEATGPINSSQVTVVGDSIVVAVSPDLYDKMPEAQIDAAEGRTIAKALPIIKTMGASGQIRQTLVLSVTANSTILDGQLDEVLAAMPADSKLVLVTGYGPRNLSWIEYSNTKIHEFASQHSDRVIIADWNSAIRQALQTQSGLLASDGVHPEAAGQELYARVVEQAIAKAQKK
ncbi:acyltransferase family protein [Rothia mucilaginosa]|uniref:acyltransferase family protein n=1 Tax=Rothia mucilaginosa TaxID=43675 RepID=UPI00195ED203|nr:acyltransferase family protein [Rothia mucilaginosa]VTY06264.1 O-acetyltransferase OatA [Rothia mucilaginosa]